MSEATPILNVVGQKVALGPLHRGLIPHWVRWLNDFEVRRNLAMGLAPVTAEEEEAWYQRMASGERAGDRLFAIYDRETLEPIGITGLHQIDHQHGTAEFGIFIGEKRLWGAGRGTDATRLMLEYGFTALGLHNILLRVYEYNQRGIAAYRRAGFREIGRRRQGHRFGGRAWDVVYMDCLATEFQGEALAHLIEP